MTLLKASLCFALIFAAAVLFPLRRAQQAFAARTGGTAVTSVPRHKLRRRPGRTMTAARDQHGVMLCGFAAPTKVKAPRRRRITSTVAHGRTAAVMRHVEKLLPDRQPSTAHASHDATGHCDFAPPGRAVRLPQPECLSTTASAPPPSVTTQAVGDIPEPPPKLTL